MWNGVYLEKQLQLESYPGQTSEDQEEDHGEIHKASGLIPLPR